ncbi:MAG: 4-hydroxy-tetrahydrodipicolinate synthase [Pseudomonadota bacterium]|nr:4-hydroxy-tetrahydrodipicolinate synthase [Pseudomonadota bacterium]
MKGVWTALITPLTATGEIDVAALDALLAMQKQSGIEGIVVLGSTGEGMTLTVQEKLTVLRRVVSHGKPQLKIMCGTGTLSTYQTVEFAKLAVDSGADSLLITTPPYIKPSTAGLMAHYQALADASAAPLCLYHIPARTGQSLTIKQFQELATIPQITAIKEAGSDMAFYSELVLALPSTQILSGDDLSFLPSLAAGGKGCISVLSNVLPAALNSMYLAYLKGDNDMALGLHQRLLPLMQALFWEANPAPIKALLAHVGKCQDILRMPLVAVQTETKERLQKVYDATVARL